MTRQMVLFLIEILFAKSRARVSSAPCLLLTAPRLPVPSPGLWAPGPETPADLSPHPSLASPWNDLGGF